MKKLVLNNNYNVMKKSSLVRESLEKVDDKEFQCKLCFDTLRYHGKTGPMSSHPSHTQATPE